MFLPFHLSRRGVRSLAWRSGLVLTIYFLDRFKSPARRAESTPEAKKLMGRHSLRHAFRCWLSAVRSHSNSVGRPGSPVRALHHLCTAHALFREKEAGFSGSRFSHFHGRTLLPFRKGDFLSAQAIFSCHCRRRLLRDRILIIDRCPHQKWMASSSPASCS